jgi:hypothetical protein
LFSFSFFTIIIILLFFIIYLFIYDLFFLFSFLGLQPYSDELKYGGNRVENHFCEKCNLSTRFPRYNVGMIVLSSVNYVADFQ